MLIYHNIHNNHIHRYTHIYIFKHTNVDKDFDLSDISVSRESYGRRDRF